MSAASYSHKVLFSIDIVHRFIKESPSPSPSREGWARLFFLLFLVGADEGDFGVVGRELVLHRGALGETGTDALDVGVAELHGGAGGVTFDGGTEAAEEPIRTESPFCRWAMIFSSRAEMTARMSWTVTVHS